MNSADIKREILQSSDSTGIRKKLISGESGLNNDDIVEMGIAFEEMVKGKGWSYIETHMVQKCSPALILETDDPNVRIAAKTCMHIMQWIDQTIRAKNNIVNKQNEK